MLPSKNNKGLEIGGRGGIQPFRFSFTDKTCFDYYIQKNVFAEKTNRSTR